MAIITVTNYTSAKDKTLSPHFKLHEFKCPVSTTIKYSEELIAKIEQIFNAYPQITKAIITSGYRTPEYSPKVGGTCADAHTVGIAADIKFYKQNILIPPKYIACIAQDLAIPGIGVMKNDIHLDVRTKAVYCNNKWWGDETNIDPKTKEAYSLSKHGQTFYQYFNLTKEDVDLYFGIVKPKPQPTPAPTPVPEPKEEEPKEPQEEKKEPEEEKKIEIDEKDFNLLQSVKKIIELIKQLFASV